MLPYIHTETIQWMRGREFRHSRNNDSPLRSRTLGDTDPYTTPAQRQKPLGGKFLIGHINALYSVVSTSPSSMAVGAMTTKPSAVTVIALPAAAMTSAGMTYAMP